MRVVVYERVNDFYEKYKAFMLQKEAVMQLIFANVCAHSGEMSREESFFGACVGKHTTLLFCNCQPFNLVVCSVTDDVDKEAVRELALYLIENKLEINGINANKEICDTFINVYTQHTGVALQETLAMDIMELRELNPIKLVKGTMRKARASDVHLIACWEVAFAKEALGEEQFVKDRIDRVRQKVDMGIIFLFENGDGKIVSMVDAARKLKKGIVFNDVYTPREERGKGYAQTNMFYVSQHFLNEGKEFCTLFVDKKNPISNRVYKKIGYEIVEDNYDYRIL